MRIAQRVQVELDAIVRELLREHVGARQQLLPRVLIGVLSEAAAVAVAEQIV